MIALSSLKICRAWADGLLHNRTFLADASGAEWKLRIGAEMLRPPSEADTPFLYLFPDGTTESGEGGTREIGALLGIVDSGWTDCNAIDNTVPELRGLERLDNLERILRESLRMSIPMPIDLWSVEFELVNFPLLLLNITVNIQTLKTL